MSAASTPVRSVHSIGQVSQAAGVSIDTIRFYERIGLLPPPPRTAAGYRMYSDTDQQRLSFIRRAQDLGFSLQQIASLLQLSQSGSRVAKTRALAVEKLAAVREKLAELERLRAALESLIDRCPGSGDPAHCPIIGAFTSQSTPDCHEGSPARADSLSTKKITARRTRKARST